MVTVKVIYRTDKTNKKNEHPFYLRIIKNRKPKYISLGVYLHPEYWDAENEKIKSKAPNAQYIINYIAKKVSEAQAVALQMETTSKYNLPEKVKEEIMGKAPESFFKYAGRYLKELDCNKQIGTYRKAKAIIGKVREYTNNTDLLFDHITVTWLKGYEQYLRTDKKNRINTINSNFRVIRRIINAAINEDLITDDKNAFKKFKLSTEKGKMEYLTEDELQLIEQAPLEPGSNKDHHRNMYIFSAYAGGLRISDILMLRWKHYVADKIVIETKKTGSVVSIKLPSKALEILEKYKTENIKPEDFIFPFFKSNNDYADKTFLFNAISSGTSYTNDDLKDIAKALGIKKKVSFHTARHTFATRILRKGVRIEYVSKLLGHASITTTQIYAKVVNEELDKAMEVLND